MLFEDRGRADLGDRRLGHAGGRRGRPVVAQFVQTREQLLALQVHLASEFVDPHWFLASHVKLAVDVNASAATLFCKVTWKRYA